LVSTAKRKVLGSFESFALVCDTHPNTTYDIHEVYRSFCTTGITSLGKRGRIHFVLVFICWKDCLLLYTTLYSDICRHFDMINDTPLRMYRKFDTSPPHHVNGSILWMNPGSFEDLEDGAVISRSIYKRKWRLRTVRGRMRLVVGVLLADE
jgi:hypothetical protein